MKKLLAFIICTFFALSIGGCSNGTDDSVDNSKQEDDLKSTSNDLASENDNTNNQEPEAEKEEPSEESETVKLARIKAKMSTEFQDFNGNYRYDWGDSNEYSLLFEFFDDTKNNSVTFSDSNNTTIAYFYNENLLWTGNCKIDADTLKAKDGSECTAQNKKDISKMKDLVEKVLNIVDLSINDLKTSE